MKSSNTDFLVNLLLSIAVLVLLFLHHLWSADIPYPFVLETIIHRLRLQGYAYNPYLYFLLLFSMAASSGLLVKGKKKPGLKLTNIIPFILFGILALLIATMDAPLSIVLRSLVLLMGLFSTIHGFTTLNKLFRVNITDQFNQENKKFKGDNTKRENQYSVNIPTDNGYINIINPFRANMVLGNPGSGKSYNIVEEYIKQQITKGYSMAIYDFKYPDLSKVAYNYYCDLRPKYYDTLDTSAPGRTEIEPRFEVFNINEPFLSVKINPLQAGTIIRDGLDITNSAIALLKNLIPEQMKKKDFWVESAIAYIKILIALLHKVEGGKYLSLPHLIELSASDETKIIAYAKLFPDLKQTVHAYAMAQRQQATQQLSGMISSAIQALAKLNDPKMYYVLQPHPDNLDLNINKVDNPSILCLANDPQKTEAFAAPLGLILSNLAALANQKHRRPLSYIIDELPTLFIMGIPQLINTGRSNKISVLLALQDQSQMDVMFGKDETKTIINNVGNLIAGAVGGEAAKSISEMIGDSRHKMVNYSHNKEGTNINVSHTLSRIVPPSDIKQLGQAEFVGLTADTFDQQTTQKFFRGKVIADKSDLKDREVLEEAKSNYAQTHLTQKEKERILHETYHRIGKETQDVLLAMEVYRLQQEARMQQASPSEKIEQEAQSLFNELCDSGMLHHEITSPTLLRSFQQEQGIKREKNDSSDLTADEHSSTTLKNT